MLIPERAMHSISPASHTVMSLGPPNPSEVTGPAPFKAALGPDFPLGFFLEVTEVTDGADDDDDAGGGGAHCSRSR